MNRAPLRTKSLFASLATTAVLLAGVAGTSFARGVKPTTFTGTNGPFLYQSMAGSPPTFSLKASSATGTAVTVSLTASSLPQFSADGTKAVWTVNNGSNWTLNMANSDGTSPVTVMSGTGAGAQHPTFSPNGVFIAFDYSNDIYVINSSSTGKTISDASRLTTSSGFGNGANQPQYVTATKIAYIGNQPGSACNTYNGIFLKDTTVAGNGSLLSNSCNDGMNRTYPLNFDVSPDGQWVVYRGAATNNFISFFKTDGTGSRISGYAGSSSSNEPQGRPVFSPDGTKVVYTKGYSSVVTASWNGSALSGETAVTFPAGVTAPTDLVWTSTATALSATTTTTAAPTTTAPATTTTVAKSTTAATGSYANAKPGITVTDTKVYTEAPAKVADDSSIRVLSIADNKTLDIETKTPSVCLPNDDELIFLNTGTCIASIVNAKTRAALRTVRTTVVSDDISEVKVGNSIVTLAPIFFKQMSSFVDPASRARIASIKKQVSAAGSVLVVGYSGTLNGSTPENLALSRARAMSTVRALKLAGAEGPFAISGVGALDPVSRDTSEAAQAKNRRAVIVLIP